MRNSTQTWNRNVLSSASTKGRPLAVALICACLTVAAVEPLRLAAQSAPANQSRFIPVTVTDPMGRFVTGLEQEHFVVLENGAPRPITYFSGGGSPISIAVVSAQPLSLGGILQPQDELIQTSSFSDAVRQLASAMYPRKVIVTTAPGDHGAPEGIQVVRADDASKSFIELRNQYVVRFLSSAPPSRFEVVLNLPRGLPLLKPSWKTTF